MRPLSADMLERMKGSTTVCHCWKLTLKDGTIIGFTDHDRDLRLDGTICRSATGVTGSEIEHHLGFAIGGSEITGALTGEMISAVDIDAGRYDAALVECWWVDWTQPELRVLLDAGMVGEIKRSQHAFTAEIRSLAQLFEQPNGRFYSRLCSAQFGDTKCKARSVTFASHIIQAVSDFECYVAPVDLPADSLVGGFLVHVSGEKLRIRQHMPLVDQIYLRFWTKPAQKLVDGDAVQLESACNKTRELCDALYRNIENFRGFPLIPPAETILLPPDAAKQPLDGGSLFQ
jgi:uncharacterized phage protein (TIGR02218 family)